MWKLSKGKAGVGLLLVPFLLAIWFVGFEGNFPLNDDWHYGLVVRALYEDGYFHFSDEISPNLLWQPFWGYLFCWIGGGFTFSALRISTLVLSGVSMVLLYRLLRLEGNSTSYATWGALLFVFSPVFFSLSFTFMTDVPFMAFMLASWLAFRHFLNTGAHRYRWLGYLMSFIAYGIRIPGILLVPCFELAFFLSREKPERKIAHLVLGILGPLFILILVEEGLKPAMGLRSLFRSGQLVLEARQAVTLYDNVHVFLRSGLGTYGNLGFWLLPLGPWIIRELKQELPRFRILLTGIFLFNLALSLFLHFEGRTFPYISGGNIFYNFGLGPVLLADVRYWGWPFPLSLPDWIMVGLGAISQTLLCLVILLWVKNFRSRENKVNPYLFFIGSFCLGYLGMVGSYSFFDRYLLPVFCAAVIYILPRLRSPSPKLSMAVLLVLMSWLSLAGTRDYLTMNRKINMIYTERLQKGVLPIEIDGGVPLNGLYLGETLNPGARYVITSGIQDDIPVLQTTDWFSYLHFKEDRIYLIER